MDSTTSCADARLKAGSVASCAQRFFGLFFVVTVTLNVCGCATSDNGSGRARLYYSPDALPVVGVVYYPYGSSLVRSGVIPLPDYDGWTDERMSRDLDRMGSGALDFVIVSVDIDDALDDFWRSRYERFAALASNRNGPKLCYLLTCRRYDRASVERVLGWMTRLETEYRGVFFRVGNRPLILLDKTTGAFGGMHPALSFRYTAGDTASWPFAERSPDQLPDRSECACVRVPVVRGSVAVRKRLRLFRQVLRDTFARCPRVVVVHSWNDFANGNVLEPTVSDGEQFIAALKDELSRLEQETREEASAACAVRTTND